MEHDDSDAQLVRDDVAASGLSVREFARNVMARDARTVRRWISGELDVPQDAVHFLRRVVSIRVTPTTVTIDVAR